jgi:AsmA protein
VAATSQIRGPLTAFDISDATAFGGTLQAGFRMDRNTDGNVMEFRVMADDIDLGAMASMAGVQRFVPQARADFSVILKGPGDSWDSMMRAAQGSVTASVGPGAIAGFDLAAFKNRWSEREFFALADASGGNLPMRGIDLRASVNGGVARVDRATIALDAETISLEGIVPYVSRALALSGQLGTTGAEGVFVPGEAAFFIGGAWDAPYVSPALQSIDFE